MFELWTKTLLLNASLVGGQMGHRHSPQVHLCGPWWLGNVSCGNLQTCSHPSQGGVLSEVSMAQRLMLRTPGTKVDENHLSIKLMEVAKDVETKSWRYIEALTKRSMFYHNLLAFSLQPLTFRHCAPFWLLWLYRPWISMSWLMWIPKTLISVSLRLIPRQAWNFIWLRPTLRPFTY